MIVDLERNDLSRVCEPGLGALARPDGRARAGRRHAHGHDRRGPAPRPASGSPSCSARSSRAARSPARRRSSAIDHIAALEPVGRGASMGALGRIHPNGDLDLALTIRTFAVADGEIHLWVGGGIVWDSDPQAEIEESWVKARPLLAAVGSAVPEAGRRVTVLALAVGGRGLVDPDEPVLHADDEALLRGRAAFETIRVYGGAAVPARRPPRAARRLGRAARPARARQVERSGRSSREALDAVGRARRRPPPLHHARPRGRAATRPRSPSSATLPPDLEERRARGLSMITRPARARARPCARTRRGSSAASSRRATR